MIKKLNTGIRKRFRFIQNLPIEFSKQFKPYQMKKLIMGKEKIEIGINLYIYKQVNLF